MTRPLSTIHDILAAYVAIMEEIKVRVDTVLRIEDLGLHRRVAFELGQLQVRLICENIALGCLVAHGDIAATSSKKLRKAWRPADIMAALAEVHSSFYPEPGVQVLNEQGYITGVSEYKGSYLSREKLLSYWARAGDELHKGSLSKLAEVPKVDFESLQTFAVDVRSLLNHHQIALLDGERQIWTLMERADNRRVQSVLMEKTKGAEG